jgi:predicted double-glycine peptidase
MTNIEKEGIRNMIEYQIKEKGFNEDGDIQVDLTDEMFSVEEIKNAIEEMGYDAEYTGTTGIWWISKK